jgi:hypothetical protein
MAARTAAGPFTRPAVVRTRLATDQQEVSIPAAGGPVDTAMIGASEAAMSLLSKGVPLSLLLDLAFGPRSEELMELERIPGPRQPA